MNQLKIIYKVNDKEIKYPLVSLEQFDSLPNEINMKNPIIEYVKNNKKYQIEYKFSDYINIYKDNMEIYIINKNYIKTMTENELKKIKEKDGKEFLDKTFASPEDFDKNYYNYFPQKEKIKFNNFHIFNTEEREILSNEFQILDPSSIIKYFGHTSMGKSITLIGTLKYSIYHKNLGTLYINCKTLNNYFQKDISKVKQILIDEIAYLFVNEFEKYKECATSIEKYQIDAKKNTFWDLIELILTFLRKTKKYILSFDQYNNKIDDSNNIEKIYNQQRQNKLHNITIITLSSMNNHDIKEYKVTSLFRERDFYPKKVCYKEIKDNLMNPNIIKIENDEIDSQLDYIGRTFKNYNIIMSMVQQKEDIKNYVDKSKNHLKKRIYEFFGINNDVNLTNIQNLYNLLSFSVYSKYSLEEFKNILDNIPFKYFNIYKKKSKKTNKEYIKLDYRFPLIKDIIENIYDIIVLKKDFRNILKNTSLDGGGKGIFFEKIVIHQLNPENNKDLCVNFFEEFLVFDIKYVPKFIPTIREKINLDGIHMIKIDNHPFLLKQNIFGRQGLDVVIVEYYGGKYSNFYCFQITKYKKKKDLMTKAKLKENLNIMKKYMKNFFNFEIEYIYFAYIFDYEGINEPEIKKMCKNCDNEEIKYIFYDINNLSFYDIKGSAVNIKKDLNEFIYEIDENMEKKTKAKYELKEYQRNEIKTILKKEFNTEEFYYFFTYLFSPHFMSTYKLFCITEFDFYDQNKKPIRKTLMYYRNKGTINCVQLNKSRKSQYLYDLTAKTLPTYSCEFDFYKFIPE